MIRSILPKRINDSWGGGEYGASRGNRKHKGIDYACHTKSLIFSPVDGVVTKLGYPYADDLNFRYVQVTGGNGLNYRVFYVEPSVELGDVVTTDIIIGESQKLSDRYEGIIEHVHLEIRDNDKNYVNPESVRV